MWNFLSITAIACNLFIYPIDLIMGKNDMNYYYPEKWMYFNMVILFMYSSDIIINLNTSTYDRGVILKKKEDIVKRYLKRGLLFDLLVLTPFILEIMRV